jgi:hypothetical protein
VRDAHWVLEQHRQLAGSGATWRKSMAGSSTAYEAARAIRWQAALCAERNRAKAEAVARVQAAMSQASA